MGRILVGQPGRQICEFFPFCNRRCSHDGAVFLCFDRRVVDLSLSTFKLQPLTFTFLAISFVVGCLFILQILLFWLSWMLVLRLSVWSPLHQDEIRCGGGECSIYHQAELVFFLQLTPNPVLLQ